MNIFKERFAGKTILITGATSGIGEATALRCKALTSDASGISALAKYLGSGRHGTRGPVALLGRGLFLLVSGRTTFPPSKPIPPRLRCLHRNSLLGRKAPLAISLR